MLMCILFNNSFMVYATSGYAYSMGGLSTSVQQIINSANSWALCGYTSYYNTDITYSYLSSSNVLNSDIIYFSGPGGQNSVKLENNLYVISGSNNGSTNVGLSSYTLSNTRLVIFNASYTALGTSNICTAARNRGAQAAIGWKGILYNSDSTLWQSRFQSYLISGHKVHISMDYADSFSDYNDTNRTKNHCVYGNWTQYISLYVNNNINPSSDAIADDRTVNTDTIECLYDDIDYTAINKAISTYDADFDPTEYESTVTSTSEDDTSFVIDYTRKIDGYSTKSGYTFIFHDNQADTFYDNTIKSDRLVNHTVPIEDAEEYRSDALQSANVELATMDGNNRMTLQEAVLYYDIEADKCYYKVFTEYQDIDDGCYGAFTTMYQIA